MKQIKSIIVTLSILAAGSAFAEKPEWAGNGNPAAEQKEAHKEAMNAKAEEDLLLEEEIEKSKEKQRKKLKKEKKEKTSQNQKKLDKGAEKSKGKPGKGLEKQKEKKVSQQQKELDKGSEQGQESREQRKKWWKFWE